MENYTLIIMRSVLWPSLRIWTSGSLGNIGMFLKSYSWEIPTGGGSREAPPLEGAKGELKEETGLTANRWEALIRIHLSNSVTDEYGMVFLAEELTIGVNGVR